MNFYPIYTQISDTDVLLQNTEAELGRSLKVL